MGEAIAPPPPWLRYWTVALLFWTNRPHRLGFERIPRFPIKI